MKQNEFDRFFDRNDSETMEEDIISFDEFDDEHVEIWLFAVPYDDVDDGLAAFKYETPEEFEEHAKEDVEKVYKPNDIKNIYLQFKYYTENPDDSSIVDVDEV